MSSPRLNQTQRDALYERHLRPDVMAGARAAETPVAMIVAGQPGAGVPLAAAVLRRELTRTTGTVVQLSGDRLRAYHPAWRPGAVPAPLHAPRGTTTRAARAAVVILVSLTTSPSRISSVR